MKQEEIKALVSLLEDPDELISIAVKNQLMQIGTDAIAEMEFAWENTLNIALQSKIEELIQDIQLEQVYRELRKWLDQGAIDMFKGACIIAKFHYPELKEKILTDQLQNIKKDIWLELNEQFTPLEKVRIINHVLYEIYQFGGDSSNYYSPQNYYINHVIESKKGNPVSLAIIYSTLAKELGIPVYGVNLPKNFILAYIDEFNKNGNDVLFYINPYNKGAVLGKREIDFFLKQQNLTPHESYYKACNNGITAQRLIMNLINSYESMGLHDKVRKLKKLMAVFQ